MDKVRKNTFTEMSPESKAALTNRAFQGTKPGRNFNRKGGGQTKEMIAGKKLFSETLRQIYSANPKKLRKLAMVCIKYAEAGHARFAELILDRLEGPVKHEPTTVNNLNIFSEADRQRAINVVDDIIAMDRIKTITLPQLTQETPNGNESDRPESIASGDDYGIT